MLGKFKVITLCGSTKFKNEFMEVQKRLTLEGNIVLLPGVFEQSGDEDILDGMSKKEAIKTKNMLDEMHRWKINVADEIFVVNVDGYIGESTKSEIEYAKDSRKKVDYLVHPLIGKKVRHKYENMIYTVKDVIVFDDDTFGQGDFAVITDVNEKLSTPEYLYECEIEVVD